MMDIQSSCGSKAAVQDPELYTYTGTGVGVVRISVKDNDDTLRTANLVLRSAELQKVVTITQKYNSDRFEIVDYEE